MGKKCRDEGSKSLKYKRRGEVEDALAREKNGGGRKKKWEEKGGEVSENNAGGSAGKRRKGEEVGMGMGVGVGMGGAEESVAQEGQEVLVKSQVIKLLRARGQPITLFGECDGKRLARLRRLEREGLDQSEQRKETGLKHGFEDQPDGDEEEDEEDDDHGKVGGGESRTAEEKISGKESSASGVARTEPAQLSTEKRVIKFIRQMLDEWEDSLLDRSDDEKVSVQGRKDHDVFKQCKQYIRPFLKLLKHKEVAPEILSKVDSIVSLCKEREYAKAGNAYIQLAVGNAPWPIGVTMVGIHARKGRERINQSNVAHVMNDEAQRKYITSLKRIIKFCQTKYPTDPSKMLQ